MLTIHKTDTQIYSTESFIFHIRSFILDLCFQGLLFVNCWYENDTTQMDPFISFRSRERHSLMPSKATIGASVQDLINLRSASAVTEKKTHKNGMLILAGVPTRDPPFLGRGTTRACERQSHTVFLIESTEDEILQEDAKEQKQTSKQKPLGA